MTRTPSSRRRLFAAALGGFVMTAVGGVALVRAAPEERLIKLTVRRFEYSRKEIELKLGQPVVIEITSLDVPHGFNVPDFRVRTDVLPGKVGRVRFTPDRTGTFVYLCDIFCGSGHEQLDGHFIVRS